MEMSILEASDISFHRNRFQHLNNSVLDQFADMQTVQQVSDYHRSLPGYVPTPLHRLVGLAARLGVDEIMVKDESHRFGLNAFKALGASYAAARVLADRLGMMDEELDFDVLLEKQSDFGGLALVTATDGNHGRAVAWTARQLGCRAVVRMPKGSSEARLEAIRDQGANASITNVNYDDTVRLVEQMAKDNDWVLLQDTSWPGYTQIPTYIMQGYFTLVSEYMRQAEGLWPTHVFLQAGVGSMAAAVLACFCCFAHKALPRFVIVEPNGAPCFYLSSRQADGDPYTVRGDLKTIMAGLACGEPSLLAWEILKTGATAFVQCADAVACRGMRVLGNPLKGDPAIVSGESGAVTLGLVYEILSDGKHRDIQEALELDTESVVLLLSTEGDTDPDIYRQVVWS
jgi:diaminopropionate ammonia-lyase